MQTKPESLFPFEAIVGQDEMKIALILNAIDPGIGGVLIKGEKGTAKSTTVRSLVQVLPESEHNICMFHCDPKHPELYCPYCREDVAANKKIETEITPMRVVELPLSATEDRIAGTLDLEHVLKTGKKKFEPGILAQANGNVLYIDEVNLLEDYIVDMLLDSAAMGVNYVEREGVSFTHPAKFILIGSMNPEEGDLRPQLLDRFGLCVNVKGEKDISKRAEIVYRRLQFEADPKTFYKEYEGATEEIKQKIIRAREKLSKVKTDLDIVKAASFIAVYFKLEGHRADINLIRAGRALAAFENRDSVTREDLGKVAPMVLEHRIKKTPFEKGGLDREELDKCLRVM